MSAAGRLGVALALGVLSIAAGACSSAPTRVASSAPTTAASTATTVGTTATAGAGCRLHPPAPGQPVTGGEGMEAVVPAGWTVHFLPTQYNFDGHGSVRPATLVAGNFGVADGTPSFGSGAVETMGPGNVFVSLTEYPLSPLSPYSMPCSIDATRFLPNAMEHPIPGMGGVQAFFSVAGRDIGLYAVLGSYADRERLVPLINAFLAGVTIRPR